MRRLLILALLPLAACQEEPENIQAKAENLSRDLERRASEIENEAENAVAAQIAPLDNEADALLNQLQANAAGPLSDNGAAETNAQ
jgi:predicted trehalose synthase